MNIETLSFKVNKEDTELHFLPPFNIRRSTFLRPFILFLLLLAFWFFGPLLLRHIDETAGNVDQSIWLLVLLSQISFMLIAVLCWWLLQHFWMSIGLPSISILVSRFNTLTLWQQLSFYWACFALLLLAALLSLSAIC